MKIKMNNIFQVFAIGELIYYNKVKDNFINILNIGYSILPMTCLPISISGPKCHISHENGIETIPAKNNICDNGFIFSPFLLFLVSNLIKLIQ